MVWPLDLWVLEYAVWWGWFTLYGMQGCLWWLFDGYLVCPNEICIYVGIVCGISWKWEGVFSETASEMAEGATILSLLITCPSLSTPSVKVIFCVKGVSTWSLEGAGRAHPIEVLAGVWDSTPTGIMTGVSDVP